VSGDAVLAERDDGCRARPSQLADLPDAKLWRINHQLGALGLILNCITLWNTVYLDAALARLRDEGDPVRDEDVVRLSP
jgi:Tn3 transposase DDE domain